MSEQSTDNHMTIEGIDIGKVKNFPFSALKTLGSIQIGLGAICICIGVVDFLMYIFFEDKFIANPALKMTDAYHKVDTLTKTCTPVWCGIWFCVTGAFAVKLSEKKMANINYYKMTFLILSITCGGVSGPLCFIISVTSAYLRHQISPEGFRWLVPLLITFFAFCEVVFAIVSASVCCCCAPFDSSRVRVLLAKEQDNEFHAIVNKEKSKDSFDIFTTADKRGKPLPPRHEEIKQPPSNDTQKQRPTKQDRKEKPTNIDDRKPERKAPSPKADDNRRTRDRKPERKQSPNNDVKRRNNSDDFDEHRFEDDEPIRSHGYNNRPYTKDSSYEQLKSLVIPKTAPKQTF